MQVFLILAVVGSAIADGGFPVMSFPGATPVFAPQTPGFGFAPPTNRFVPPVNSAPLVTSNGFLPKTPSFAPSSFQPAVTTGRGGFNLDSTYFQDTPADSSRLNFNHQNPTLQTGKVVPHIVQKSHYQNDDLQYGFSSQGSDSQTFTETGKLERTDDGLDNVIVKTGHYSYISPEGVPVSVSYIADKRGFQPISDNIPLPVQTIAHTF